jgi:hypothetical protein
MKAKIWAMVFWVMTLYSLVGDFQHFGGVYHPHHLISSCEILVTTYKTTWYRDPEQHNTVHINITFFIDPLAFIIVLPSGDKTE